MSFDHSWIDRYIDKVSDEEFADLIRYLGEYPAKQATVVRCGIMGGNEVTIDADGFITLTVLVGESGLYAGAPPEEVRIEHVIAPWMADENLPVIVAQMNSERDLPLYICKAKIKIIERKLS